MKYYINKRERINKIYIYIERERGIQRERERDIERELDIQKGREVMIHLTRNHKGFALHIIINT